MKKISVLVLRVLILLLVTTITLSSEVHAGYNIYKIGDTIIGRQYNDFLESWIDKEFSIWVGHGGIEVIVFKAETVFGSATIVARDARSTKKELQKVISKAIEWSNIAVENQVDITKKLGCFGGYKRSFSCNNTGEMKLTFFATNGGRQRTLIVNITDRDNQFIKASLYFEPPEMKKILDALKEVEKALQKAKDNESKQNLFK